MEQSELSKLIKQRFINQRFIDQSTSSRNLAMSKMPMIDGVWAGIEFPEPSFDMCKLLRRKKQNLKLLNLRNQKLLLD